VHGASSLRLRSGPAASNGNSTGGHKVVVAITVTNGIADFTDALMSTIPGDNGTNA